MVRLTTLQNYNVNVKQQATRQNWKSSRPNTVKDETSIRHDTARVEKKSGFKVSFKK